MAKEKQSIVCECGHTNPEGTVLCEACGNPLEDQANQILNMRYEGTARRSQVYNRTIIDKIWNYFSSVKIGITLIILVVIAIAIGTIFPQLQFTPATETNALDFYEERYGTPGYIYVKLGFHQLYGSWWFAALLGLLGTSIIIASLDRYIPLRRALKNQRVVRHNRFLIRQRLVSETSVSSKAEADKQLEKAQKLLSEKRYRVKAEDGNVFAEKGRFSRWGPYVNHIGLIIILTAGMLHLVPGMYVEEYMWVREGETQPIPGTNHQYYITNHNFLIENYENKDKFSKAMDRAGGTVPKNYQSNVTLYKVKGDHVLGSDPELKKVKDYSIQVNKPLPFGNYRVYQSGYRLNAFYKMSFKLQAKKSGKSFGSFTVNLDNPKEVYKLGDGYKVKVMNYFPDFYWDDKKPDSKSPIPNNPAFIFRMITPDKPKGEVSFIGIRRNYDIFGDNKYKIAFNGVEMKPMSGLMVKKDLTLWIAFTGTIIFLIGVAQGMYWNHRRIWLKADNKSIWIAATTNKNWLGVKKDLEKLTDATDLNKITDRLEEQSVNGEERRIQT